MARLIVIRGRATPPEIRVDGEVLLGRARDADLRILDETASRRHALIRPSAEGRTLLEDLGSANGTHLNGERVHRPAALFDGDVIAIGDLELRFVTAEDADRDTVAAPADEVAAALDPAAADPARLAADAAAVRRLALVCRGAAVCAEAADPTEVCEGLLALAREALAPDRATVVLLGPAGRAEVAAAWPAGARPPESRTLRQRVLEGGEAVLVRDTLEPGEGAPGSLVRSRYRSALLAPLATGDGVAGFVAVEAQAAERFAAEDLEALAAAARQAALALRNLRALDRARTEVRRLSARGEGDAPPLLGASRAMADVRAEVAKAAGAPSPVLVTGETGTGKELVARRLHAEGPRHGEPFVAVNCAALVEGLLESELFGHEKGAFTGAVGRHEGRVAAAGRGTLFLDEIGELSASLQAKLLRVLSEGTFTRVGGTEVLRMACRVVAATHRDLRKMVAERTFREDLYYRLAVVEIALPPLRERREDVVPLAEASLERLAARLGRPVPRLLADARAALEAHAWPGNVRELLNVLERALVLSEGEALAAGDLRLVRGAAGREPVAEEPPIPLREAERRAVRAALRASGGRKGKAAEILGISWPTLNRKIREYGLDAAGD